MKFNLSMAKVTNVNAPKTNSSAGIDYNNPKNDKDFINQVQSPKKVRVQYNFSS